MFVNVSVGIRIFEQARQTTTQNDTRNLNMLFVLCVLSVVLFFNIKVIINMFICCAYMYNLTYVCAGVSVLLFSAPPVGGLLRAGTPSG